jgi:hypothetical protein
MTYRIATACFAMMVVLMVGGATQAWGQAGSESPAPAAADAKAKFDKCFADYKAAFKKIEGLRTEFQTADAVKRQQINQQLSSEVASTQKLVDAMVAAATAAYRAAPNQDPVVTNLLIAVAKHEAVGDSGESDSGDPRGKDRPVNGGDQYEAALPIIQLLVDGGAKEKQLPIWGFVAAFATND